MHNCTDLQLHMNGSFHVYMSHAMLRHELFKTPPLRYAYFALIYYSTRTSHCTYIWVMPYVVTNSSKHLHSDMHTLHWFTIAHERVIAHIYESCHMSSRTLQNTSTQICIICLDLQWVMPYFVTNSSKHPFSDVHKLPWFTTARECVLAHIYESCQMSSRTLPNASTQGWMICTHIQKRFWNRNRHIKKKKSSVFHRTIRSCISK